MDFLQELSAAHFTGRSDGQYEMDGQSSREERQEPSLKQ
jgi:hypothetical protein